MLSNTEIRKQVDDIRTQFEKLAGGFQENTSIGWGSAMYPKIYKGDKDGEIAICIVGDGEPQGFAFFEDNLFSGRVEEGIDGDLFRSCKTTEDVFAIIKDVTLSESNVKVATGNLAGASISEQIIKNIWG